MFKSLSATLFSENPFGPFNTVLTVNEPVADGLNITVQVRVTLEPTGCMGVAGLLMTLTEVGTGTEFEGEQCHYGNVTV